MSEYAELVKRLRAMVIIDEVRSYNQLGHEAASAIEVLEARLSEAERGKAGALGIQKGTVLLLRHAEARAERLAEALRETRAALNPDTPGTDGRRHPRKLRRRCRGARSTTTER